MRTKTRAELIVVMPVGPQCRLDFCSDTLESIAHYTSDAYRIIVIDDSGAEAGSRLRERVPEFVCLTGPGGSGNRGGMFRLLSRAYLYADEHYDFDVLLRLDTDALMIGPNPGRDAAEFLRANPDIGMLGSYRVDCLGRDRHHLGLQHYFHDELAVRRLVRHPVYWAMLRWMLSRVKKANYELAEHCLGGAYFLSAEYIRRLARSGLLSRSEFRHSRLSEDWLFSMLVKVVGPDLGDFAIGDYPLGLAWRGLPMSPEDLVTRGKKIIHSTRYWIFQDENDVRTFFRQRRACQGWASNRLGQADHKNVMVSR